MNILILILRLLHVIGGVFWVGGVLILNFFVVRAMGSAGDIGKQFAGYLMGRTRLSAALTGAAVTTVIAGFLLYGIDSAWFTSAWQSSGPGIGFSIGALFALIGLVAGLINGRNNKVLGQLGMQIQGKPTAEQAAKLTAIQKQQGWIVPVNSFSLLLAIAFMAVSRYLHF